MDAVRHPVHCYQHVRSQSMLHPTLWPSCSQAAEEMGFAYVAAGPLVRSSYKAGEFYLKTMLREKEPQRLAAEA